MKHNSIPPCSPTVLPLLDTQYPSQKDVASTTGSFPLKKGAVDSSCTAATGGGDAGPLLPFWGQFSCRLMAQPVHVHYLIQNLRVHLCAANGLWPPQLNLAVDHPLPKPAEVPVRHGQQTACIWHDSHRGYDC